jgi:glycosyltransferase involved in cell wall biosynthesis
LKSILFFSDWFTPAYKAGGPIQSIRNLSLQLSCSYQIFIYTSAYDLKSTTSLNNIELNTWTDFEKNVKVFYQTKKKYSKKEVIEFIRPDYIYLNSIFSREYTLDILRLRWTSAFTDKIILAPRGMLKPSALNKKFFKKWIFLNWSKLTGLYRGITFHATNEQEKTEIQQVFKNAKVRVIDNLPPVIREKVISMTKETGTLKIICIGRIHPIKNIDFLLHTLSHVKSNIQLTILGSVEDENYKSKCEHFIATLPLHVQVKFISEKPHNEVGGLIAQHHLMALPTLGENYGHAIIESLAVGRPVLISDQTPWKNLHNYKGGWELPLSDKQAWINTIEEAAAWDQETFDVYCLGALDYARVHTNNEELVRKYIEMFSA